MVGYRIERQVAVLEVAQPPLNGLTRAVRAALMEAIDRAEEDDAADAIVLIGAGGTFPAGTDVTEYDRGLQEPFLRDLCDRVEYSEKPVVAALNGTVFGGGLELALAAHYRVAHAGTRFGLPEIHLGLPPAGGGSQRLPRLVGAAQALDMLGSGRVIGAGEAAGARLTDLRTEGDVRQAALDFCDTLRMGGTGPRRLGENVAGASDPAAFHAAIAEARAALSGDRDSLQAQIVMLVEAAALLPFEAGCALEAEIFNDCLASDRARALRHVYLAERRAAQGAPDAGPEVQAIAVLGSGGLAVQLVARALMQGLAVIWAARDGQALETAQGRMRALLATGARDTAAVEALCAGLSLATCKDAAAQAGPGAVLITERGYDDLPWPEGALRLPAYTDAVQGVGLRFVPPAHRARLVEVLQGPDASRAAVLRAAQVAQRLGKLPVRVVSDRDTLAGRLNTAMNRAADALIDLGCSPYAIDAALLDWGMPQGVLAARDRRSLVDLARIDLVSGVNWCRALVEAGRMGAAEGGGFYDWKDGTPVPSESVLTLFDAQRPPRGRPPENIRTLILGAMANEGLHLLAEGRAVRASDLDVVSIHALNLPREQGGVMKAVSLRGLFGVMRQMERLGHPDTAFWTPHPEWGRLVKNGLDFDAL
ncbi:enoyl-CoA hydratase-related protein [Tropicibacter sp. S64]|uniref:enoyl-CoA hydratase/isomerase family protein n=1 Tax=Tropicibacter sp. S64 TaxID=3415122 RepID=UPI003C7A23D3